MRILPILSILFLIFCIGHTSSSANDEIDQEKIKKMSLSKENDLKEQTKRCEDFIRDFIKKDYDRDRVTFFIQACPSHKNLSQATGIDESTISKLGHPEIYGPLETDAQHMWKQLQAKGLKTLNKELDLTDVRKIVFFLYLFSSASFHQKLDKDIDKNIGTLKKELDVTDNSLKKIALSLNVLNQLYSSNITYGGLDEDIRKDITTLKKDLDLMDINLQRCFLGLPHLVIGPTLDFLSYLNSIIVCEKLAENICKNITTLRKKLDLTNKTLKKMGLSLSLLKRFRSSDTTSKELGENTCKDIAALRKELDLADASLKKVIFSLSVLNRSPSSDTVFKELDEDIRKSKALPYQWLDEEVLDINNFKEATETLIKEEIKQGIKEVKWSDSKKPCPRMVRYFKELNEDDLPTILKWLKLKDLEYFGIASTDESADIDLIYLWSTKMEEEGIDLKKEGLYKLIYLNAKATLHKLMFNIGTFPEEWLENHRAYHSWNFCYRY